MSDQIEAGAVQLVFEANTAPLEAAATRFNTLMRKMRGDAAPAIQVEVKAPKKAAITEAAKSHKITATITGVKLGQGVAKALRNEIQGALDSGAFKINVEVGGVTGRSGAARRASLLNPSGGSNSGPTAMYGPQANAGGGFSGPMSMGGGHVRNSAGGGGGGGGGGGRVSFLSPRASASGGNPGDIIFGESVREFQKDLNQAEREVIRKRAQMRERVIRNIAATNSGDYTPRPVTQYAYSNAKDSLTPFTLLQAERAERERQITAARDHAQRRVGLNVGAMGMEPDAAHRHSNYQRRMGLDVRPFRKGKPAPVSLFYYGEEDQEQDFARMREHYSRQSATRRRRDDFHLNLEGDTDSDMARRAYKARRSAGGASLFFYDSPDPSDAGKAAPRSVPSNLIWGQNMASRGFQGASASTPGASSSLPWNSQMMATAATAAFQQNFQGKIVAGLRSLSTTLGDAWDTRINRMESEARRHFLAGAAVTGAVTVPAVAMAGAALKQGMAFDKGLHHISALTDVNKEDLPKLSQGTLKVSMETGRSPQELVEALYSIASIGTNAADSMKILEVSAMAATAGLGGTKTVADTITGALKVYGDSADRAAHYSDVLTMAVNLGKGEAESYAPAIGKVLASAKLAGIGFEEVAANIATFTNANVTANMAGTALNMLLENLRDPSMKASRTLETLGSSVSKVTESLREKGLLATLQELWKLSGENSNTMSKLVGSVTGLRNALSTVGAQGESYEQIMGRMKTASGAMLTAFEEMSATASAQWDRLLASGQAVFISLAQSVLPQLNDRLESMANETPDAIGRVINAWEQLPPVVQNAIKAIGMVALVSGPLTTSMALMRDFQASVMLVLGAGFKNLPLVIMGAATAFALFGSGLNETRAAADGLTTTVGALALAMAGLQAMRWGPSVAQGIQAVGTGIGNGVSALSAGGTAVRASYVHYRDVKRSGGSVAQSFWNRQMGSGMQGGVPVTTLGGGAAATGGAALAGTALTVVALTAAIGGAAIAWENYKAKVHEAEIEQHNLNMETEGFNRIAKNLRNVAPRGSKASHVAEGLTGQIAAANNLPALESVRLKVQKERVRIKADLDLSPGQKFSIEKSLDDFIRQLEQKTVRIKLDVEAKKPQESEWDKFVGSIEDVVFGKTTLNVPLDRFVPVPDFGLGGIVLRSLSGTSATDYNNVLQRFVGKTTLNVPLDRFVPVPDFGLGGIALRSLSGTSATDYNNVLQRFGGGRPPAPKPDPTVKKAMSPGDWANWAAHHLDELPVGQKEGLYKSLSKKSSMTGDQLGLFNALEGWRKTRPAAETTNVPTKSTEDLEAQQQAEQRMKDAERQRLQDTQQALTSYGGALEGIVGKIRAFGDESEEARMRNEMLKLSVQGINGEWREQAIALGRVHDQMQKLTGQRDGLRQVFEGAQTRLVGLGQLKDPNAGGLAFVEKLLGYRSSANALFSSGVGQGATNLAGVQIKSQALDAQAADLNYKGGGVLGVAQNFLGMKGNDSRALELLGTAHGEEWCAGFVRGVLKKSGQTNWSSSNRVMDVRAWAESEGLAYRGTPNVGDVFTISRGRGKGHSGFVTGVNGDKFTTIAGNEGAKSNAASQVKNNNSYPIGKAVFIRTSGGGAAGGKFSTSGTTPQVAQSELAAALKGVAPDFNGGLGWMADAPEWMHSAWGGAVGANAPHSQAQRELQSYLFSRQGIKNIKGRNPGKMSELIAAARRQTRNYDTSERGLQERADFAPWASDMARGTYMSGRGGNPFAELEYMVKTGALRDPSVIRARRGSIGASVLAGARASTRTMVGGFNRQSGVFAARSQFLTGGKFSTSMADYAGQMAEYEAGLRDPNNPDSPINGLLARSRSALALGSRSDARKYRNQASATLAGLMGRQGGSIIVGQREAFNMQVGQEQQEAQIRTKLLDREMELRSSNRYTEGEITDELAAQEAYLRRRLEAENHIDKAIRSQAESLAAQAKADVLGQAYGRREAAFLSSEQGLRSELDGNARLLAARAGELGMNSWDPELGAESERARLRNEADAQVRGGTLRKGNEDLFIVQRMGQWREGQRLSALENLRTQAESAAAALKGVGDASGMASQVIALLRSPGAKLDPGKAGATIGDMIAGYGGGVVAGLNFEARGAYARSRTAQARLESQEIMGIFERDPELSPYAAKMRTQRDAIEDATQRAERATVGADLIHSAQDQLLNLQMQAEQEAALTVSAKERVRMKYELLGLEAKGIALTAEDLAKREAINASILAEMDTQEQLGEWKKFGMGIRDILVDNVREAKGGILGVMQDTFSDIYAMMRGRLVEWAVDGLFEKVMPGVVGKRSEVLPRKPSKGGVAGSVLNAGMISSGANSAWGMAFEGLATLMPSFAESDFGKAAQSLLGGSGGEVPGTMLAGATFYVTNGQFYSGGASPMGSSRGMSESQSAEGAVASFISAGVRHLI
jgi:TP901 family phage tail tape measure protein